MSAGELTRMVRHRPLPAAPVEIEANEAERAALAARFGVTAIERLNASVRLTDAERAVEAVGTLRAEVVQPCAVSGEDFTMTIAEDIASFIPPVHEAFFGLRHGEATGRPAREVIENTRLPDVLRSGKAEIGHIQRMRGQDRVVSRIPIRREGEVVGAIGRVMFRGPEQVEELSRRINALEREVAFYRRTADELRRGRAGGGQGAEAIVGESRAIAVLRDRIRKVAPLDVPVLITGESGTGKELVARSLHHLGPRRAGPLVAVNAAALPATLVESELFGYAPGAFTGADRKGRKGRFEQAEGGTIFLDEIGDMPLETQAKLLRVLQDRAVEPIGGDRAIPVDFRLITATHHDLPSLVEQGRFRLDLYYRISAVSLEVPRLADRPGDIGLLARHVLAELAETHGRPPPELTPEAEAALAALPWPGNVRQLRHAVERALIFAEGNRLTPADFGQSAPAGPVGVSAALKPLPDPSNATTRLRDAQQEMADSLIREALRRAGGNKKRAAAELGISRSHLYKRLEVLGLE
ncbi:sigma 54-interacting transcriptional regulator [Leptolyngbya sp. 15MV]|nr:sigma 54-interacting transcriptional regulator [Leptolyngbya sp. 15MV]